MTIKFLSDDFIIWKARMGKRETVNPGYDLFVAASNLVKAHEAAMIYEREMIHDGNLVLSVEVVADCILDARNV